MKNYIKPTFTLAGLAPVALAANSCSMTTDEAKEFVIDAGLVWNENAFGMLEDCGTTYEELETFCKFTAGEIGAITVLGS